MKQDSQIFRDQSDKFIIRGSIFQTAIMDKKSLCQKEVENDSDIFNLQTNDWQGMKHSGSHHRDRA